MVLNSSSVLRPLPPRVSRQWLNTCLSLLVERAAPEMKQVIQVPTNRSATDNCLEVSLSKTPSSFTPSPPNISSFWYINGQTLSSYQWPGYLWGVIERQSFAMHVEWKPCNGGSESSKTQARPIHMKLTIFCTVDRPGKKQCNVCKIKCMQKVMFRQWIKHE